MIKWPLLRSLCVRWGASRSRYKGQQIRKAHSPIFHLHRRHDRDSQFEVECMRSFFGTCGGTSVDALWAGGIADVFVRQFGVSVGLSNEINGAFILEDDP